MTTTQTPGQILASELRRYFSVGTRTRRFRKGDDLHERMIEAIGNTVLYPGYYHDTMDAALHSAYGVYLAYMKHINGYRVSGDLRFRISSMSPWRFAGMLGDMLDARVTCTGDGERYFAEMGRAAA